jgi:hypothetical protein
MPVTARLAALFCGLLFAVPLVAAPLDAASYGYPLTNPFEATIATTPPELRPELPEDDDIRQSDYRIRLRPEREFLIPKNFWAVQKMGYRLAEQRGKAPLVFIIAGTGAHYSSSHSEYLKRLYYGAGFHVVQLSSPTSYDFMASASRRATPGLTGEDADDLYRAMQAIRAQHPRLKVSGFHLAGYSLGALQAAFVSQIDETRRSFSFEKVLLLNPPVNLYTSVHNLDRLVQTNVDGVTNNTTFYELVLAKLTRYFRQHGYIDLNQAMLFDFQQSRQRLTDEQMAMLIGTVFRFSAADIAFTSDLINRRGLIIPPNFPMTDATSLTPFFKRALQCDFQCYMNDQLLPLWSIKHEGKRFSDLVNQISLYAVEDYLRDSDKIMVMHNADDFILGPGDLGYLRKTLGDRLVLYPLGGHCGNLNYRVNAQAMLEFHRD